MGLIRIYMRQLLKINQIIIDNDYLKIMKTILYKWLFLAFGLLIFPDEFQINLKTNFSYHRKSLKKTIEIMMFLIFAH